MSALRPLPAHLARACAVRSDGSGRPRAVDGVAVEAIREEWRVEEGWWGEPVRRRCFAVVLAGGRLVEVHEDRRTGTWWRHGR